jgi:DNA-binding transcriptional regulator YiaG
MRPTEFTSCTDSGAMALQMYSSTQTTSGQSCGFAELSKAPFWASGVFAALLIVGTGGSISSASTSTVAQELGSTGTGSVCRIQCVTKSPREDEEDQLAASPEGLPVIRHHLSLNLSDVAAALRVSRPTIYAWLRGESSPHFHNKSRMRSLYRVAKMWSGMSQKPLGSYLKLPVHEDRSIFDLLCEEKVDSALIRAGFTACARMFERDVTRLRPRSASEIAKQFGLRSQSSPSQEESVAQETGL